MPSYTAYVEREMGSVVALVKVLQSRPESLVDTYLLLMPPAAQSAAEFQRLCELKVGAAVGGARVRGAAGGSGSEWGSGTGSWPGRLGQGAAC